MPRLPPGALAKSAMQALFDRFGAETIAAARDEIFRQTEALEREAVAALPDGVYTQRKAVSTMTGWVATPCP